MTNTHVSQDAMSWMSDTSFAEGSTLEDFFRHMYRQFTEQEWGKIRSSPDEWQQLASFYRNWVSLKDYFTSVS